MIVRPAEDRDNDAIWNIMEPVIRAGENYALPHDMSRETALAQWRSAPYSAFVAEDAGEIVGTFHLKANPQGGGAHVANCGYMTARGATGRGVTRTMCEHSLQFASERGFRAMQFNFVVSTNERAVRLWQSLGFEIVGRLPEAFDHPSKGYVDALVM